MRVLVTGASGMLGRAVATALLARGAQVTTLQRRPAGLPGAREVRGSVTDPATVRAAVTGQDAVVHLAAKVSFAGPEAEFAAVNVGGTEQLLSAARAAGATRFVFVSSPSVAHTGRSIVGAGAAPARPDLARGTYARTKAAAELRALAADAPGFAVVAVRPHIVWGPGDTQLVQRVVDRAAAGRLPVLDRGAALIDTTYLDNAVSALLAALDRAERVHGEAFVVTNGEPRPVAELIAGMCRAAGVPPPRWAVPGWAARAAGAVVERAWAVRPGEDEPPMTRFLAEQLSTAHWFDLRRTRAALSWEPAMSLDEGFARLAEHYRGPARRTG
ncbi:NAD-dependent epimerase/dehydratase family protein [Georgenia sp. TF02-10]|uniref:NAD-dependent epimerase/dehydratase family protein n=1 Tax=Georgenia sp. TF02-10 TaxID=2917725 RepID=UPI001FA80EF4|nr:NAD-dependent epimerase/dehydratase family protein [Georgenia sp. TF02-10]UNX53659.1 NAD-dependent epimerase/dehydratase family protein [Georgenia sp. TF02-10]